MLMPGMNIGYPQQQQQTGFLGNLWNVAQGIGSGLDWALGGNIPNWMIPGGVTPQQAQQMPYGAAMAAGAGEQYMAPMMGMAPGMQAAAAGMMPMQPMGGGQYPMPGQWSPPGKRYTVEIVQYPDGSTIQRKITRGGVALYNKDLAAVKRVRKMKSKINRWWPSKRDGKYDKKK